MKETQEHFDCEYTKTFDPPKDVSFIFYNKKTWEKVRSLIPCVKICADFGCGGGTLLYNIALVSKDHSVKLIGIDFSIIAIRQAKNLVPLADFLYTDIFEAPLRPCSCDLILSTMTIEHVDDRAFLREVRSVLRPSGYFVVTSVLKTSFGWYYLKNDNGESVLELSHLREYRSEAEFRKLLENEGFKVLLCETARIRFPVIDPIFKFLMNKTGWSFLRHTTSSTIGNFLRKLTRFPVPGYYAIEAVCQKIC